MMCITENFRQDVFIRGGDIQNAMYRMENLRQDIFLRGGGIQNSMCRMENLRQDVFLGNGGQNHEMYEVGSLYIKAKVSNMRFRDKIGGIIHFSAQSTVSEKL